jgi:hypothetical protein
MTFEPGPGLGDRRRWRADPGACSAAGSELSQVQHQVGLGTPHTRAPRPGCAEDGPPPILRIAVSRRFRSASHSGITTDQKHRHDCGLSVPIQRSSMPASAAQPRHVGGLDRLPRLGEERPQAAGAPAGSRARTAALTRGSSSIRLASARSFNVTPGTTAAVRPVLAGLGCWIVAANRCPRYLPRAVLRAAFCEAAAPLIASCCRLLSAMALRSEAERLGERAYRGYAHSGLTS